jgi:single-strand DNA-binding protein
MNKAILIGRLCGDVDLRHTNSGTAVASYRLAVDRGMKQEGQPEADFLNCVAFGKNGEFAGKYLRKGVKIAIVGRIQTRSYDDKDGKKVYVTEIVVENHEFCEKKTAENSAQSEPAVSVPKAAPAQKQTPKYDYVQVEMDDDLPFN